MNFKYDKRSKSDTLDYISRGLGYKVSTLNKNGKRGKPTKTQYWMIEIKGASPIFVYNLNDMKLFIKSALRGLTQPTRTPVAFPA